MIYQTIKYINDLEQQVILKFRSNSGLEPEKMKLKRRQNLRNSKLNSHLTALQLKKKSINCLIENSKKKSSNCEQMEN